MFKKLSLAIAIVMIAGMASAIGSAGKAEAADQKANPDIPLFTAEKPPTVYLFKNVKVFDGISDQLKDVDVLVVNNLIRKIGKDLPITGTYTVDVLTQQFEKVTVPPSANDYNVGYSVSVPMGDGKVVTKKIPVTVIDGKGRTLMPGLIDMHSHMAVSANSLVEYENTPWDALGARTALVAEDTLMDGFTTVRDVGGMHGKGIKLMIDSGELPGPRVFPSGGFIGATSSHADLRMLTMRNPNLEGTLDSNLLRLEVGYITDGVDDVLAASRRNFQMGASQLKLMIGGGVATEYDPWHSTTFTYDEIKAAVDVAQGYGSYVTAHINQPESMQLAIKAGVSCIEHGFVMDEETMKLLVDKGVWLSAQMTGTSRELAELPSLTPENLRKLDLAHGQMDNFIPLVKKYKPKQVFAVDAVLASRDNYKRQRQHEIYLFANIFGNFEMLKAATSSAGELLAQTKQTTYHAGKIGVIEKGAYADLLLVDGNPLTDISVIGGNELWLKAPVPKPIETIRMIMKDGVIYKNTL